MNKTKLNSLYGQQVTTIAKILLKLKFNVRSVGFKYWESAVISYIYNYFKYNNTIEQVYIDVAKQHNTTRSRVERAMRTARKTATEEIQKEFNYNMRLTNKAVLELITHNYRIIFDNFINHIPRID